ncbi:hypothetical protein BACEGG_00850 [Bacteroides eggerthii DSM 20697]|nr:hypothetical protein BACEGG_00850 [Bacteroides eggerthii DSM 20697]
MCAYCAGTCNNNLHNIFRNEELRMKNFLADGLRMAQPGSSFIILN